LTNEFYAAKQVILLYFFFELRAWIVPGRSHDSEAGVRDLPHYLGKSPDGYMNAFPVEQATGVEKSRRP
jgi:hypothetical protein